MRIVRGTVATPAGKPVEVVLVRPPLYLTKEEWEQLSALAVAAGLAPDPKLERSRRRRVRNDAVAEYCRRVLLTAALGITHFPSQKRPTQRVMNHPLRALARQYTIGGRFRCRACESRNRRKRRLAGTTMGCRLAGARGATKAANKRTAAALRKIAELEGSLSDLRFELRRALLRLEELGDPWAKKNGRAV